MKKGVDYKISKVPAQRKGILGFPEQEISKNLGSSTTNYQIDLYFVLRRAQWNIYLF